MHQLWNKLIAPKNQRKILLGILNLPIDKNNIIYNKENLIALLSVAGTFFAYFSIVIVNFGDFSRYSKSESEVNKGNLSLLLNLTLRYLELILIRVISICDPLLNIKPDPDKESLEV